MSALNDILKISAGGAGGAGVALAATMGGAVDFQAHALDACANWTADYKDHIVVGESESYEGKFIKRDEAGNPVAVLFISWSGRDGQMNEEMAFDAVPDLEAEPVSVLATEPLQSCMRDGARDVAPFE